MPKPKPVNWELLSTAPTVNRGDDNSIYDIVSRLIQQYYSGDKSGLSNLGVVIMWRHNVRPDQDGFIPIADISRSSDKMRELMPHDVIIGINKSAWRVLSESQKQLIIDAQLSRVVVCLDKDGNPKEDDRSRIIYRLKRMEVIDDRELSRRHNTSLEKVQEYVSSKISGDFSKGSYVDQALNGGTNGSAPVSSQ